LVLGAITAAIAAVCALPANALASGSPQGPPAAPTSPPFQQCAAVYLDPSCGYLIDITSPTTSSVLVDPTIGFYEGQDDVLVGVQNDSTAPVSSIHVGVAGSNFNVFGFDGDGLCTPGGGPVPADCPFGPTGDPGDYYGPDAVLTVDPNPCPGASVGPCSDDGTVSFPVPLQPGQYTYFSLEAPPDGGSVLTGNQNDAIQTQLYDGTTTSAHLSEPNPPTSATITDQANLVGPNVFSNAGAGGTVTYSVYSDPACTKLVGTSQPVTVSGGSVPASTSLVASPTANTVYYVQATYSGDPATSNDPATTNCGDETITFGTPAVKQAPTITTALVGSNHTSGASLSVPTTTAVHDTASVTVAGKPQNGRVTYYVYTDASCTTQVPLVNLGSGAAVGGVYPPSATVTLPNGTYYFQVIYSGNGTVASGRSPCTAEVLTVSPPCACARISAYLNNFHIFGAGSTRLEFNIHSAISCTIGGGGCTGTLTVSAPGSAKFIDSSKAKNGGIGLKLKKSTATLPFTCEGPCAATTVQPVYTLQWLAFKKVKVKRKGHKPVVRTVPDPKFLPKGRANKTISVKIVEKCNGVTVRRTLKIHFDKHGQVDYKKSDLNGDGIADGAQLTDATGFR
jgi:hypothetical protein